MAESKNYAAVFVTEKMAQQDQREIKYFDTFEEIVKHAIDTKASYFQLPHEEDKRYFTDVKGFRALSEMIDLATEFNATAMLDHYKTLPEKSIFLMSSENKYTLLKRGSDLAFDKQGKQIWPWIQPEKPKT